MLTLSVRQPWPWLILNGGKDIENRDWPTRVRGRVLIHAAKGCTVDEWKDADQWTRMLGLPGLPPLVALPRGGVVGSVEIVNCVTASNSRWFSGKYGFVLRDPRPLPFTPWSGLLGFFDVDLSKINGGDTL